MSHRLACDLSDRLAGVASVAATMLSPVAEGCDPSGPLPMIFFHGSEDQVFPRGGRIGFNTSTVSMEITLQTWAQINAFAGQPELEELPDTANDETTVTRWTYTGCGPGSSLVYFDIDGGGHNWPGSPVSSGSGPVSRDISASHLIARFTASN
jgi:polyhydroxybutyrate depolymerase